MANDISNIKDVGSVIAKMAAGMFSDNMQFLKTIDKEPESAFEGVNGFQAGDTININRPAVFTMNTTADVTSAIQDVKETRVSLALDKQRNVPVQLTSAEIATDLALKNWATRILKPAVTSLSQGIENECLVAAKNAVFNSKGTAGSTVFDTDTMLSARELLMKNLAPQDGELYALLDSTAMRSAVNARKGLFHKSDEIAKQYKAGYMGTADGFNYLENNLLPRHTVGGDVAAGVEATVLAPATGASTLGLDGVGSGLTIKKGDVFTIADVYAVHPITKQTLPHLQQFVVTADVTETASNQVTVSISPTIYSSASGSLQNVSALPADEAAVTFIGTASTAYQQSLCYHKSAFRFVSVPLVKPDGVDMVAQETVDGITIRVLRDYNSLTDKMLLRLDVLYGFAAVRPEWACRLWH